MMSAKVLETCRELKIKQTYNKKELCIKVVITELYLNQLHFLGDFCSQPLPDRVQENMLQTWRSITVYDSLKPKSNFMFLKGVDK
jgi:hypothetical protein